MKFTDFGLLPELLQSVKDLGYLHPTPIQVEAIPPALLGKDVLGCAATGSGKTAAFVLPILQRLSAKPRGGTRALVLTPTRELAAQITEALQELATHTSLAGAAVYGGVGMGPQEHALRTGIDIIVATPGRLLDHMKRPYTRFDRLEVLVIDEADRMLDMGFLPDIKRILRALPAKRQTLFFSATMPPPIAALTREMLHNPVMIDQQRRATPPALIAQAIYPVAQHRKSALLLSLLERDDVRSAIVFTRTKHRTNRLTEFLERAGVSCACIHGNRSQGQRERALDGFKVGKTRVLVATDIASRGIDVEELSHVINFDVPHVPEDYIHRVGRTGRAGLSGAAFTFVSHEEEADLAQIERALNKRLQRIVLPDFDYNRPAQGENERSSGRSRPPRGSGRSLGRARPSAAADRRGPAAPRAQETPTRRAPTGAAVPFGEMREPNAAPPRTERRPAPAAARPEPRPFSQRPGRGANRGQRR